MKKAFLLFILYLISTSCGTKADFYLNDTAIIMADSTLAAKIVSTEDDYTANLSTYDLSIAAKNGAEATLQDFLQHLATNVREWTDEEKETFKSFIDTASVKLDNLNLNLPDEIIIIKTSSLEYGGIAAGYTRQNALMLTERLLRADNVTLFDVLLHEIFHVYTRANPKKKEELYNIIGFYQASDVSLPDEWYNRRITNPDAPALDVYIDLAADQDTSTFIPLFYARAPYNPKKMGGIFQSAFFGLMKVEKQNGTFVPLFENGVPQISNPSAMEDYWKKIGRNSNYIIHPEEIMASNFVFLVNRVNNLPNPEIIDAMYQVITE